MNLAKAPSFNINGVTASSMASKKVALYKRDGEDTSRVCLYAPGDDGEMDVFAVADILTTSSPWEIRKVWAPGYGSFFYPLLIALSGKHGLTPCRDSGEVVAAASAIWKKMSESAEIKVKEVEGPHLDSWLNSVYFFEGESNELKSCQSNHELWTRGGLPWLPKWLQRALLPRAFSPLEEWQSHSIHAKSESRIRRVSDVYWAGGEGDQAKAVYVARLFAIELQRQCKFELKHLDPAARYEGFTFTNAAGAEGWLIFQDSDHAENMSRSHQMPIVPIPVSKPLPYLDIESDKSLAEILSRDVELERKFRKRFGANAFALLQNNWSVVAGALGFPECCGFATSKEIHIVR